MARWFAIPNFEAEMAETAEYIVDMARVSVLSRDNLD